MISVMSKQFLCNAVAVAMILMLHVQVKAQEKPLSSNYVGFVPSVLIEPYDTINAIEVNFLPLLYEFRMGEKKDVGLQLRPILNYRFFETKSGFSQMGVSVVANKYFLNWFGDDFWLVPMLGVYCTYAYNRLDNIQTMTLGIEPGAFMRISNHFSMSVNLQPGLNYYPDEFSKAFVDSESGLKGHFGFVFHIGYNF